MPKKNDLFKQIEDERRQREKNKKARSEQMEKERKALTATLEKNKKELERKVLKTEKKEIRKQNRLSTEESNKQYIHDHLSKNKEVSLAIWEKEAEIRNISWRNKSFRTSKESWEKMKNIDPNEVAAVKLRHELIEVCQKCINDLKKELKLSEKQEMDLMLESLRAEREESVDAYFRKDKSTPASPSKIVPKSSDEISKALEAARKLKEDLRKTKSPTEALDNFRENFDKADALKKIGSSNLTVNQFMKTVLRILGAPLRAFGLGGWLDKKTLSGKEQFVQSAEKTVRYRNNK